MNFRSKALAAVAMPREVGIEDAVAISDEDVALLAGPDILIDGLWYSEYGAEIEYRYRAIPFELAYLLRKYEILRAPHKFFVEDIATICDVGEDKANEFIDEVVRLELISAKKPAIDRRRWLYFLTAEQKQKLYRIRKGEAVVPRLAAEHAKNPKNLDAGLTEENKHWYRNIMRKVFNHDAVYQKEIEKLAKIMHLLRPAIISFAIYLAFYVLPAMATMSGGVK
jgi:DNA-binding MarR family transcriptional regulator